MRKLQNLHSLPRKESDTVIRGYIWKLKIAASTKGWIDTRDMNPGARTVGRLFPTMYPIKKTSVHLSQTSFGPECTTRIPSHARKGPISIMKLDAIIAGGFIAACFASASSNYKIHEQRQTASLDFVKSRVGDISAPVAARIALTQNNIESAETLIHEL